MRWRAKNRNWQKTFKRKVNAIIFQSELLKSNIVKYEASKVTFDEFAEIWLERHCRIEVEESTAIGYEQRLRESVTAFFKGMTLSEIDEDDVIRFKEWLTLLKGYSATSVGNYLRHVKLMFNCACRWKDEKKRRYLQINPAQHVKSPKLIKPDFRFWTSDEIRKFLNFAHDKHPQAFEVAALITATGLRRGELYQLQSDCLDFENKILTVKSSYSFATRKPKPPKGGKLRRIPMNAEVCRLLLMN